MRLLIDNALEYGELHNALTVLETHLANNVDYPSSEHDKEEVRRRLLAVQHLQRRLDSMKGHAYG